MKICEKILQLVISIVREIHIQFKSSWVGFFFQIHRHCHYEHQYLSEEESNFLVSLCFCLDRFGKEIRRLGQTLKLVGGVLFF